MRSASRTSVLVECDPQASVDEDFADVHKLVFEDDEEEKQEEKEDEEEEEEEPEGIFARADNRVGKYLFGRVSSMFHPRPPFAFTC